MADYVLIYATILAPHQGKNVHIIFLNEGGPAFSLTFTTIYNRPEYLSLWIHKAV